MSASLELVRSMYPDEGMDWAQLVDDEKAALALFDARLRPVVHHEFEVRWPSAQPLGLVVDLPQGPFRTPREWVQAWRQMLAGFETFRIEPQEFREVGDKILVVTRNHARPRGSDSEIVIRSAAVWTFEEGKVRSIEEHYRAEDGLAALGLDV